MGSSQLHSKETLPLKIRHLQLHPSSASLLYLSKHTVAYVQVWKWIAKAHKSSHSKWQIAIFCASFNSSEINKSNHRSGKNVEQEFTVSVKVTNTLQNVKISSNEVKVPVETMHTLPLHSPKLYYSYPQLSLRVIYTLTCTPLQSSHKSRSLRKSYVYRNIKSWYTILKDEYLGTVF